MSVNLKHTSKILAVVVAVLYLGSALAFGQTAPRSKAPSTAQSQAVNINQATAEQLTALPGVGAVTAKRIVEFRQKNGPFQKVEDLLAVRGIGEKTLGRMKSHIVL